MDGIGFISGPQKLTGLQGIQKAGMPQVEIQPTPVRDSIVAGYAGPEIQDPRKAFLYNEPEIKSFNIDKWKEPEIKSLDIDKWKEPEIKIGGKPEIGTKDEIFSIEGFYLSGSRESFGDFDLNGPSSLGQGIISLSGKSLNSSNPKVLFQE